MILEEPLFEAQDPHLPLRKKSWKAFQEFASRKRKSGAFQYVPLEKIAFPPLAKRGTLSALDALSLGNIRVLSLSQALLSYAVFLQNRKAQLVKEEKDPFVHLNSAVGQEGIFLYVPPGEKREVPIELFSFFGCQETFFPQVYLYLGKGASLEVVVKAEKQGFCNLFVDVLLDERAHLSFYESLENGRDAVYLHGLRVQLKKEASFRYFLQSFGAKVSRNSLKVDLLGDGAEVLLEGVSALRGELQHHIHAEVVHHAPCARSRQHFKTVLEERSLFSFEGKIFVKKEALKTESYQLCNQLLLSDEVRAYAKPNLEIFADDVKASHGATFGKLDLNALFYLQSRGLSKEAAQEWLIEGFYGELIERIQHERAFSYFPKISEARLSR